MSGMAVAKKDYVLIQHDHVSDASSIFQRIQDASRLFDKGAPPKLMVDSRYYMVTLSHSDRSAIAGRVREKFPDGIQIAVLLQDPTTASQVMPIIDQLGEAGLNIKVFETVDAAEMWLAGD